MRTPMFILLVVSLAIGFCFSAKAADKSLVLYLSFDHHFPRFIWERSKLSMRQREYLELKAQVEVERHIAAIMEKQNLGF